MRIFFLKKTGLSDFFLGKPFLCSSAAVISYFLGLFLAPVEGAFYIITAFCSFIVLRGMVQMSHFFLYFLRQAYPYEKVKKIEGNKEYILHYFPFIGQIRYFYKGKLHREEGAAVIFEHPQEANKYFYEGNEVSKDEIPKLILQNKVGLF